MTTEALVAQAVLNAAKSPTGKQVIINGITSGEVVVSNVVHGTLDKVTAGGIPGLVVSIAKPAVEAELDTLINQYTPEVVYDTIIIPDLTAWAKGLGATV